MKKITIETINKIGIVERSLFKIYFFIARPPPAHLSSCLYDAAYSYTTAFHHIGVWK